MKKTALTILILTLVLIAANTQAANVYHKPPFKPTNDTDICLGDIKVNGNTVSCSANILSVKLVEQKVKLYATYSLFTPKILDAATAAVVPIPDQENKKMAFLGPKENERNGELSFNVDMENKKVFPKIYVLIGVYAYAENPLNPETWNISFDFAFASVLCISNKLSISKASVNTGKIYYRLNWGDGTYSTIGPYKIGSPVKASHHWKNPGTYQIKVKIIGGIPDVAGKWFPLIKIKTDDNGDKKPSNKKMNHPYIQPLPPINTVHKHTLNLPLNKPTSKTLFKNIHTLTTHNKYLILLQK